ncbi:23S rRNA m(5)U-1939 methyltransferase [Fibrobacter sp. UWR3]|uniref:class I SAM-dependent RNA methyltransferase n=1 Tax=Fibrobacter sp. UWR3 TaxID=1896217 RepID=UPI00092122F9|nr:TRAM domain-containing protein [Fibrobacter sp. UWR3]SHM36854.1 23S rRNA m(5)U-1939 methyltransferase [Fibrobacter sp. UWR3]
MFRRFDKLGKLRRSGHKRPASARPAYSAPAREVFEVRIEKMVQGGEGMARLPDGRVCFVSGALPGELCKVAVTFTKKDFARGHVVEVLEGANPDRVEARCPLYGKCGGCSLQHLESEKQAEYLAQVERENFRRIARIELPEDFKVHTGPAWGYRNRARVVVVCDQAGDKPIVRFGFRKQESNSVALFKNCPVLTPALNEFLQGRAREIFAGKFRPGREMEVNLFDNGAGEISYYYEGMPAREFSENAVSVSEICGKKIEADASVFFQSNLELLPALVKSVRNAVDEGLASGESSDEWLIDLFSGVGFFAAMLMDKFKRVTTVEREEKCLQHAEVNLSVSGGDKKVATIENVSAPAEEWLASNVVDIPATLIVDPPRTGLPKEALDAIADSSVNRLIYVSCHPVTLARDTALLAEKGFKICRAEAFAFYPQTPHLEMMLVLAR